MKPPYALHKIYVKKRRYIFAMRFSSLLQIASLIFKEK